MLTHSLSAVILHCIMFLQYSATVRSSINGSDVCGNAAVADAGVDMVITHAPASDYLHCGILLPFQFAGSGGLSMQASVDCPRTPQGCTPLPPTSPGGKSTLLAVCPQLPPSMQRKEWCLEDYVITDKLYKGYASMGEQIDCCAALLWIAVHIVTFLHDYGLHSCLTD
jgi:hypothetical protein